MNQTDKKKEGLLFLDNLEKEKVQELLYLSDILEIKKNELISKQFEQSHSFYFLLNGEISFSINVENNTQEFPVGKSDERFTPVGWAGFRPPNRYATTIRCNKDCELIKWSHADLAELFESEPLLGKEFLFFVLKKAVHLLNQVWIELAKFNNSDWYVDFGQDSESTDEEENIAVQTPIELLRQSPFFEIFSENDLYKLADIAEKKYYLGGDRVFTQGEEASGIDLLATGRTAMCFSPEATTKPLDDNQVEDSASLRLVQKAGYVVGWAGAYDGFVNDCTAVATRNAVIYHFSKDALNILFNENPYLALNFARRLLWLLSNQLRNARARLISQHYEFEITSIRNLMEQNAAQLSVTSPLHKIPHLLTHAYTLEDAFKLLFQIEKEGSTLEKGLARLSLDILGKIYKEHLFFDGLKKVYQFVAEAPQTMTAKGVRVQSSRKYTELFRQIPHAVEGWENLPDEAGNIFISNHLVNHPYNTLPNSFQITLDSHFISSMILYKKYGDPGIRVVRVPRSHEFGHENYYSKLGHINVFTKESDNSAETGQKQREQNKMFYKTAAEYIESGQNLMLSPEGTSYRTEDSPGPFKPGAFRLAASIDPEPYIVPIVVANFDKRLNRNVFSLIVKEPFKISEHVENPLDNREGLAEFLTHLQNKYRAYVSEAVALADKTASAKINLKLFESVKKDSRMYSKKNMVVDEHLFEDNVKLLERKKVGTKENPVVFYGSSSVRLWERLDEDFAGHEVLNLGFGGATIDYCAYYFDRLVKP
ncbi:MAG: hypothetical protein GWO07_09850, partial [Candidatus Dadabacteria bacterium]|nr:hypothetical protein [Candidatus Dadabacteria bacterium]NIS09051.1 hypothetical protein [Candidatus Dadabacteria bacterium]NIX15645.1 hypothetical protein [Candidatus Dadabacteria bacterium]NIY22387.1 hypothetical protein [Candidatus Dadabacteria bacterium]